MRIRTLATLCLGLLGTLPAALLAQSELIYTVMAPSPALAPGSELTLNLVAFNPTRFEERFIAPGRLTGTLLIGERAWDIELNARGPRAGTVDPGGFASRVYALKLPDDAIGRAVLELTEDEEAFPSLRAALMIAERAESADPDAPSEFRPIADLVSPSPAADALKRAIAGRLNPHEPIYFLYGPDAPAAKFQFSFKYRLLAFDRSRRNDPTASTLQLGYTQRSLWDIDAESSPFYDTSYMPEVFFEKLQARPDEASIFTPIALQVGFKHESNGRDLDLSRSLNVYFARFAFALGSLDEWNLLFIPEAYMYARELGDIDDNPFIRDYRGYGKLRLFIGKNDGPSLTLSGYSGSGFDHPTIQVDFNTPIRTRLLDFGLYFHVQYFDGYGESLLQYQEESRTVRAGVSLVR